MINHTKCAPNTVCSTYKLLGTSLASVCALQTFSSIFFSIPMCIFLRRKLTNWCMIRNYKKSAFSMLARKVSDTKRKNDVSATQPPFFVYLVQGDWAFACWSDESGRGWGRMSPITFLTLRLLKIAFSLANQKGKICVLFRKMNYWHNSLFATLFTIHAK